MSLNGVLKRFSVLLLIVLFLGPGLATAQSDGRTSETDYRSWYMYFGDHPIGEGSRLGVHFDAQLRTFGLADARNQLVLRPGLNFDFTPSFQLSGGYAYASTRSSRDAASDSSRPEHRFWEQLLLRQPLGRTRLVHRYRLEQRFVGDGSGDHTYRNRFRYFLKATVPMGSDPNQSRYFAAFYNEIMLNFGANLQNNIFDQNRTYAALGIRMGRAGNLEIGYLLQIVQQGSGQVIEYNHALQIGFFSTVPLDN